MKTTSNINPESISPDWGSIKSGKMDLLIHWDITENDGIYEYQEERIRVDIPNSSNHDAIEEYITANKDRFFRIVGAPAPSDDQWKTDVELALLDLAGA